MHTTQTAPSTLHAGRLLAVTGAGRWRRSGDLHQQTDKSRRCVTTGLRLVKSTLGAVLGAATLTAAAQADGVSVVPVVEVHRAASAAAVNGLGEHFTGSVRIKAPLSRPNRSWPTAAPGSV